MAADSPDASLSASEIHELRRLIAARQRFGGRADSLTATLVGVFAAGFLALFGWMAFQTHANSAAIAVLQNDVAALRAGQRELKAGQAELKADMAEIKAGQRELRSLLLEQQRR